MAKKNFSKGIDNVFSSTMQEDVSTTFGNDVESVKNTKGMEHGDAIVSYNIRYPKELQKRIKMFCIEHEEVDMKDVFLRGAVMYMDAFQ